MSDALSRHVSFRTTPQREQARADQVKNNAGGYVFQVSDATRINRFLTLGTDGGTYYVKEPKLTKDNAQFVVEYARNHGTALANTALEISEQGRAPRNGPVLFALAAVLAYGDEAAKTAAAEAFPRIVRTGHDMISFAGYAESMRGWGRGFTKVVGSWYSGRPVEEVAYQVLKYKQRDGWAQRDIMRLAHLGRPVHASRAQALPQRVVASDAHWALFHDVIKGTKDSELPLVQAARAAHRTRDVAEWVRLIEGNRSLTWEMLPSETQTKAEVWRALIEHRNLPLGALITKLGQLTSVGALSQMDSFTKDVAERLTDQVWLRKARIHPVKVLLALKAYGAGRPMRGKGDPWHPVPVIMDALNDAFYLAFPFVEPSGKRIMEVTDTSGSMTWAIAGYPFTAGEAVGAMALVTARTEPGSGLYGFHSDCFPLAISPKQRLDDVMRTMYSACGGSTDCAAPMVYAQKHNMKVDVFRVFTDNETWYGGIHPHQALENYRQSSGIDARLQVACIAPTEFSIADPLDPRQLDVSGFDAAVPKLVADHARGNI